MLRQSDCNPLLVPHLPGPGHLCEHPEPEVSLETGGRRATAASGGPSGRLGVPHRQSAQEHHLHVSSFRRAPADGLTDNGAGLANSSLVLIFIDRPEESC